MKYFLSKNRDVACIRLNYNFTNEIESQFGFAWEEFEENNPSFYQTKIITNRLYFAIRPRVQHVERIIGWLL